MKIILAGGSGFIGTVLQRYYSTAKEVIVLSRRPQPARGNVRTVIWDGRTPGAWVNELEGADLLVNLTGKSVNCRYTPRNKREILSSRLDATRVLGEAVRSLRSPVKVWIQCASATIYRHAEDRFMDEYAGETGVGFSVDVCRQWEKEFDEQCTPHTRRITLRIAIVLSAVEGALPRLVNLVRCGLGGAMGGGRQYISWVHERDVVRCIDWLYRNPMSAGVYNCSSPEPVRNATFMQLLRYICGIRFGFYTPAWLLRFGAWLIGTETELILKSRWVMPTRLVREGYRFKYMSLSLALRQILLNF